MKAAFSTFSISALATFALCEPLSMGSAESTPTDDKPYQVCTVSINSLEEQQVLKNRLKGPRFNHIELTKLSGMPENDHPAEWFDSACKSGVQCDILLISAEYAGTFFQHGEHFASLTLKPETMLRQSCPHECRGILQNPLEVFLMGCNTLSDKGKSNRTPEEYMRVLIEEHHYSREMAMDAMQSRYGEVGLSNQKRFSAIFSGVPHLYGFDDKGPSGKTVKQHLESYFDSKGDYANYLDSESAARIVHRMGSINSELASSLRGTAFAQCSGGDTLSDRDRALRERICAFYDPDSNPARKLLAIESAFHAGQGALILNEVNFFVDGLKTSHPLSAYEKKILARIRNDKHAREQVMQSLGKLHSVNADNKLLAISRKIGWLTPAEAMEASKTIFKSALIPPVSSIEMENLSDLISFHPEWQSILKADLDPKVFRDPSAFQVVLAAGVHDPAVLAEADRHFQDSKSDFLESLLDGMIEAKRRDPNLPARLVPLLESHDSNLQFQALKLLGLQDQVPDKALEKALKLMDDRVYASDAFSLLIKARPTDPGIQRRLVHRPEGIYEGEWLRGISKLALTDERAILDLIHQTAKSKNADSRTVLREVLRGSFVNDVILREVQLVDFPLSVELTLRTLGEKSSRK